MGSEENLEQLLVKVKFEEAKVRELSKLCNVSPGHPRRVPSSNKRGPKDSTQPDVHHRPGSLKEQDRPGRPVTTPLSNCGLEGYFARDCPYLKTAKSQNEAQGLRDKAVAAMVPQKQILSLQEEMAQLRGVGCCSDRCNWDDNHHKDTLPCPVKRYSLRPETPEFYTANEPGGTLHHHRHPKKTQLNPQECSCLYLN